MSQPSREEAIAEALVTCPECDGKGGWEVECGSHCQYCCMGHDGETCYVCDGEGKIIEGQKP